jgi:hypothetical protein
MRGDYGYGSKESTLVRFIARKGDGTVGLFYSGIKDFDRACLDEKEKANNKAAKSF